MNPFYSFRENSRDYFHAFSYNYLGKVPKTLAEKEIFDRLKRKGLIKAARLDIIEDMFRLGVAAQQFGHNVVKNWGFKELNKFSSQMKGLTPNEQATLDFIRAEAEDRLDLLFTGINTQIANSYKTRTAGFSDFRDSIRDTLREKVENRKTINWLSSELKVRIEEYGRDMFRIAFTESQNAYNMGTAIAAIRRYNKPPDELFAVKIPLDPKKTCVHCRKHFLKPGTDEPKIFRLSELLRYSNVGVKAAQWKPVAGTLHPFCRCVLQVFSTDKIAWNDKFNRFELIITKMQGNEP